MLCVCPFRFVDQLISFKEASYELYVIKDRAVTLFLNFLHLFV